MFGEKLRVMLYVYLTSVIFVVVTVRLVHLQIVQYDFYAEFCKRQSSAQMNITKNRGEIVDRNGEILAGNRKVASLYAFGKSVKDPKALVKELKKHGAAPVDGLEKTLKNSDRFAWIQRKVPVGFAEEMKSRFSGVDYIVEESRFYPQGSLLGDVLGFTGVDNQGLEGLEFHFEQVLAGVGAEVAMMKDSKGKVLLMANQLNLSSPVAKVQLTIDSRMQALAEYVVNHDTKTFGARSGIAVAMDIYTGDILFAASSENFDPNTYGKYGSDTWKNDVSRFLFEPGSIFKAVTFSYLVEHGLFNEKAKIDCENGKYELYDHVINDVTEHGILPARDVFVFSSNVGTVKLAEKIDSKDFYRFLRLAGFGSRIGVVGMSEEDGLLRDVKQWSGLSKASIAFGQEVLVTPLQVLRFYAALANGGTMVQPAIVNGYEREAESTVIERDSVRVISEGTAKYMQAMLREVVLRGTGSNAKSPIVSTSGKTGTGQKYIEKLRGYSKAEYIASFAGYYPAENPKVAMLVLYDSPKSSIYGGSTAGNTFRKLAEQMILFEKTKKGLVATYDDEGHS